MKFLVSILLLTSLLVGCVAPYQTFKMDYQYPSEVILPDSVKNIIIINRAKEQLQDQGWTLIDVDQTPTLGALKREPVLPILEKALISKLREKTGANIYNSQEENRLDSLPENTVQLIIDEFSWESVLKLTNEDPLFRMVSSWDVVAKVSIQIKDHETQVYVMMDSLVWSSMVYRQLDGSYGGSIYDMADILRKATQYTGEQLVLRLFGDSWTEKRIIFTSGDILLTEAYRFVQKNRWNDAEMIWLNLYKENESKQIKGRSAYNLALHYERKGLPDIALSWIDLACNCFETGYSNTFQVKALDYKETLEQVIKNKK